MALVTPKRFTLAEYRPLIELGFLTADDQVESIREKLMQMASKGQSLCLSFLSDRLT